MKNYEVKLKTIGPVHIGSGETKNKNGYVYARTEKRVYIPDDRKFVKWLIENNLEDKYEKYFYDSEKQRDLYTFLMANDLKGEYKNLMLYSLEIGDVTRDERKGMNNLKMFVKTSDQRPYIPGGSLKGAIRNAIFSSLNRDKNSENLDDYFEDKIKLRELKRRTFKEERNSFKSNHIDMSKLSISDSEPLSLENLTVSQKRGRKVNGDKMKLSVFRESLRPETKIKFKMQIKDGFGLELEDIKKAIKEFNRDVHLYFLEKFGVENREGYFLYMGGDTGFASKTSLYPIVEDSQKATKLAGKILDEKFKGINHYGEAIQNKVSPKVLKLTKYHDERIEMGLCEISFSKINP